MPSTLIELILWDRRKLNIKDHHLFWRDLISRGRKTGLHGHVDHEVATLDTDEKLRGGVELQSRPGLSVVRVAQRILTNGHNRAVLQLNDNNQGNARYGRC